MRKRGDVGSVILIGVIAISFIAIFAKLCFVQLAPTDRIAMKGSQPARSTGYMKELRKIKNSAKRSLKKLLDW